MPSAVTLRMDFSASQLRRLAKSSKDANQSRRLLSLAAVRDGMNCKYAFKRDPTPCPSKALDYAGK